MSEWVKQMPPQNGDLLFRCVLLLMRLEQRGLIRGKWGISDTKRKARFYEITAAGKRQLEKEKEAWERMAGIIHTLLYDQR